MTSDNVNVETSKYGYRNFVIYDKSKGGWYCHHFAIYDNAKIKNQYLNALNANGRYDVRIPIAFYTDSVTYNRLFAAGWNTTYLPYSVKIPKGVKAYKAADQLRGAKQDFNTKYAYQFTQVTTDSLLPNTAYLLYSANSYTMYNRAPDSLKTDLPNGATMLTIPTTPANNPLEGDYASKTVFLGTTEELSHAVSATYNAYGLSSDGTEWRMVTPTSTGYFGRFRAFVADNAAISGAKQSTVGITLFNADGTVTAIKGITVKDLTAGDGKIYSINGEYVGTDINNLAPGLYIKNGKKFIKQ